VRRNDPARRTHRRGAPDQRGRRRLPRAVPDAAADHHVAWRGQAGDRRLQAGSRVAVTFTGSNQHHRAFQVKAERAVITPARPEDMPEIERQGLLFCEGLAEIGFTKELAAGWLFADTEDMIAVEVEPERIFTQTPGPGAGAELRP
jgi:hypothetical protein